MGRVIVADRQVILVAGAGAERYGSDLVLLEAVRALKDEYEVVVSLPEEGPLVSELADIGVASSRCDTLVLRRDLLTRHGFSTALVNLRRLVKNTWLEVKRVRPAAVWVNTAVLPLWPLLTAVLRIPTVVHCHESLHPAGRWKRALFYAHLHSASRVVVPSSVVAAEIVEVFPWLRYRVVTVWNSYFDSELLDIPISVSRDVVVLGRLAPRKGQDVALEATSRMANASGHRVHLCGTAFRGYEWFVDRLRRLSAASAMPVDLRGWTEKHDALRLGGVLLIPSVETEACPLVVLEGMAAGRLVVASDMPAISALLPADALLFSAGDAESCRDALQTALAVSDEEFRSRCENLRLHASANFAPERFYTAIREEADALFTR
jgi:glycosyltransferase involved in cell wall biosynthesis